ncbi:MAG: lecithin retinol acyltransferase family protein [Schwartzia sp.]|nr:lecithin retinol acyltransferase family protein [Schwartzia sp. (in: firmicutes)]
MEKVYTASETLARAIGRIGENLYNVKENNCEHFAFWCKFKVRISSQIGRIFDFFNDVAARAICQRYHNCVIC